MTVGDIKNKLDMPSSTLSHHIAKLVQQGLIRQERHSRTLLCWRNYELMDESMHYLSDNCCRQGQVSGVITTDPFILERKSEVTPAEFDVLVIRKDPPFDKNYLHVTYGLDFLPQRVVQFNSPQALRDVNEKLFTLDWAHYCPDSVTTMNPTILRAFAQKHSKIL